MIAPLIVFSKKNEKMKAKNENNECQLKCFAPLIVFSFFAFICSFFFLLSQEGSALMHGFDVLEDGYSQKNSFSFFITGRKRSNARL